MPKVPKDLWARAELVDRGWANLRPGKMFAGLTLEQYRESVKPSHDIRLQLKELEGRTQAANAQRKQVDINTYATTKRVVFAVKADAQEGENGELYRAMGFVPVNQRSRPRLRAKKEVEASDAVK